MSSDLKTNQSVQARSSKLGVLVGTGLARRSSKICLSVVANRLQDGPAGGTLDDSRMVANGYKSRLFLLACDCDPGRKRRRENSRVRAAWLYGADRARTSRSQRWTRKTRTQGRFSLWVARRSADKTLGQSVRARLWVGSPLVSTRQQQWDEELRGQFWTSVLIGNVEQEKLYTGSEESRRSRCARAAVMGQPAYEEGRDEVSRELARRQDCDESFVLRLLERIDRISRGLGSDHNESNDSLRVSSPSRRGSVLKTGEIWSRDRRVRSSLDLCRLAAKVAGQMIAQMIRLNHKNENHFQWGVLTYSVFTLSLVRTQTAAQASPV
ncbi:hypothetical protein F5887DRAFT_924106 [Amanita rubescens]|nr:hypothetical protein F5887DRAFT_924106 [Amanita rubescens]